jgi:DNA ligase-1
MDALLLRDWKGQDTAGWLMSEKRDGWRLLWDGADFFSRQGQRFDVPEWFKVGMPDTPLDGELFAGRGMFNFIQARIRDGWRGLTFEIFDAPAAGGTFAERLAFSQRLSLPSHARLVEHVTCDGAEHMRSAAASIIREGGEGVVMRNPIAYWKPGRSLDVLRWVPIDPKRNRLAV